MKSGPKRKPIADRLLARRRIEGDCWIYTGAVGGDGYGVIGVGRERQLRAHRASYREFVGPIPAGMLVCHRCDTPLCINPKHLFLGTPADNTRDMVKKGRRHKTEGAMHPMAKLSDADVAEIKRLRANCGKLNAIASQFGISFQHVSALARGLCRASA